MSRRSEILAELAEFKTPSAPLVQELKQFGWDWQAEPLLVLRKEHFLNVIDRYLSGELSAAQLQEWAENLECREDVAFDEKDQELLDDVFFRIATPFINAALTHESVNEMRRELLRK